MTSDTLTAATVAPDTTTVARAPSRHLFTLTIFLGSFLLFMVQPMVARMALPRLGGAPAVWNSAMLVYQALLLAGYAWAHGIGRVSQKSQLFLHGALLLVAAVFLPIGLAALQPPTDGNVLLFVPKLLLLSVGPILLAVSAQAPLIQRWFSVSAPGANPYALYAASNLGSFGGLIAYPLLVEPLLPLVSQSVAWTVGYAVLLLLTLWCGYLAWQSSRARGVAQTVEAPTSPRPSVKTVLTWILLAAVPSGMMLSTTTHLTTDIMAMPLLWAIPLGLYLLSFSLAFSEKRLLAEIFTVLAPPMLLLSGGLTLMSMGSGGIIIAVTSLLMLFSVAVALHSQLYALRPAPDRLTFFYLMMAVGGAVGGLFCALIAPLMFDWVYEHPILVLLAALLVRMTPLLPWPIWLGISRQWYVPIATLLTIIIVTCGWTLMNTWSGLFSRAEVFAALGIVVAGLLSIGWRVPFVASILTLMIGIGGIGTLQTSLEGGRTRSYFGVYTVRDYPDRGERTLSHGTTLHGTQLTGPNRETIVTSYYGPNSGIGLTLNRAQQFYGNAARVGIVGLGTGTLSCYRRDGETWTIFEIDPAMVNIARDPKRFTFLSHCAPNAPIIIGDARLKLQERPQNSFDVLAVDAFSSDAIPIHLLTKEAFDGYGRVVQHDGLLLVHISNRFVNLEPVLRAITANGQWTAVVREDDPDTQDLAVARTSSIWVAMSRNPASIRRLESATANEPNGRGQWRALDTKVPPRLWTDDFSSVLPLLIFPKY